MKTFFSSLHIMALVAILGLTVSSCNNNSQSDPQFMVQEFATFVGNIGETAEFQVQRTGNAPVYNLFATGKVDESNVPPRSRVIITYSVTSNELPTSGTINLQYVAPILDLQPKVVNMAADSLKSWNSNGIYLEQIFRTGQYVNYIAKVSVGSTLNDLFRVYVDSASLDTDQPKLFVSYKQPNIALQQGQVPVSINLNSIWPNPNYNGVTISLYNTNDYSKGVFEFLKSNENWTGDFSTQL